MIGPIPLFVFGTIIGSFLNVAGLRWDESDVSSGLKVGGRSKCPSCHNELKWFELIPVLSFILQRGKCRHCQASVSWQYPLVEIFTGIVFVSLYHVYGYTPYLILPTTIFCIYIVILIHDFHHKIIPNPLVYSAIVLSLLHFLFTPSGVEGLLTPYSLIDLLAGPVIFAFFASIWLLSRGRAMGFGDAKLGLSVGLLLGAAQGFSATVLSFWIGSVAVLLYMLFRASFHKGDKRLTMKSEVPFAPFIIMGAWVSLTFNIGIFNVLLF